MRLANVERINPLLRSNAFIPAFIRACCPQNVT